MTSRRDREVVAEDPTSPIDHFRITLLSIQSQFLIYDGCDLAAKVQIYKLRQEFPFFTRALTASSQHEVPPPGGFVTTSTPLRGHLHRLRDRRFQEFHMRSEGTIGREQDIWWWVRYRPSQPHSTLFSPFLGHAYLGKGKVNIHSS